MTRDEALKKLTAKGQPFELIEIEALGRNIRAFANAPASLRELYQQNRSALPFLVYREERLSFEEVWQKSAQLAASLVNDYKITRGDRVAVSMRNYPEWVIAFNAATSIGAIAVAMNALWQAQELEFALRDATPKLILVDSERLTRLSACNHSADLNVIAVRTTEALPPGVRTFDEVLASQPSAEMPQADIVPDDDAIMLFTSGSTGRAKGAVSTHRNVISALLSAELDTQAHLTTGNAQAPPPGSPQAATLLGVPLFHVSGLHVVLLPSHRAQRRVVCMYKWDADIAADLIEREQISSFGAPPTMTGDLVQAANRLGLSLASLAVVGGGGAARAPEHVRAIDKAFPNALPATGWGMTETNSIGTGIYGPEYLSHPNSSGRVAAVLDIRIVDQEGRTLGPLARGELQIRGASIMRGYWNRPRDNEEVFVDGWLRTGDVAYVDADGYVYIVDRIKELVIRGGENIGCGTVEAALLEHPHILEASVYGVPDERLGEEVAASIYATAPLEESALREFLDGRLAKFQIPRYFRVASGPLPRGASGKILKRELRDEAVRHIEERQQTKP